ncbi:MAG: RNA polymerase factor sigma-54 [Thermomicrobiales bacterium]
MQRAVLEQTIEVQQNFSPLLMQANHILSLSQVELESAVNDAMEENPALELEDCPACPVCGRRTSGEPCPTCRVALNGLTERIRPSDLASRYETGTRPNRQSDPDFDPMSIIASAEDVRQQVLEAVLASLDEGGDQAIALVLIDAIDDRGFLTLELPDIAEMVDEDVSDVERVLDVVQELSPPGVGARTLHECLALQARFLIADGVPVPPAVLPVIEHHLEDLAAKRLAKIARALTMDIEEIEAAQQFIRCQLTPHPLQSHQFATWTAPSTSGHIVPDVVVSFEGDELVIEVPHAIYDRLETNDFYREMAKSRTARPDSNGSAPATEPAPIDQDVVVYAKSHVTRAQQFIWAVRQRRQTLLRVAQYVCAYQDAFIRGDARGLRPLTRSDVANALGVHESTCSRAVAGKFMMLPSRKVIPMSDLFTASLSVKHVIQEIIQQEAAAGHALSDAQISERLLDHGIRIARRTVAKYRSQMHILPSTIR